MVLLEVARLVFADKCSYEEKKDHIKHSASIVIFCVLSKNDLQKRHLPLPRPIAIVAHMKIAFVHDWISHEGGAEAVLRDIIADYMKQY